MARCLDCTQVQAWKDELALLQQRRLDLLLGTTSSSDRDVSVKGPFGGEVKIASRQSSGVSSNIDALERRIRQLEEDIAFCECGDDDLEGYRPNDMCMDGGC